MVRRRQLRRGEVRRSVPARPRAAAEPASHVRPRWAAFLPRCTPCEAGGEDLARGDDPVPGSDRARGNPDPPALELLQRHQAPARAGALLTDTRRHGVELAPGGRIGREDNERPGRPRRPAAVHRPARRRARQGHPDRALRRHVRGRRLVLRRRDGNRPPAHSGRRRRGGLHRPRDPARPRHVALGAVAAGGCLVPRRGMDARRGRSLSLLPAGAAAARRRRLRGAWPRADRRARARVLPRRARPRGARTGFGATSTSSPASTPSAPSPIRARSSSGCCSGATTSACRRSPRTTSS